MLSATAAIGIIATISLCPFGSVEQPAATSGGPLPARADLVHSGHNGQTPTATKKVSTPSIHREATPLPYQDLGGGSPTYHLGTSDTSGGIQMMMRD